MTLGEARETIHRHFAPKPLGTEEIPLLEAPGRVLAVDVTSTLDIPPFSRSTVDGYAVKADDTFGAEENTPARLRIVGEVSVGIPPTTTVKRGSTVEIVTGAPIPDGADAVVMVEHTKKRDNSLYVHGAVAKGENAMVAGADIRKGETVLKKGTRLDARKIGVLAAIGKAKIRVYNVPRVAVLSSGAEVSEPGKTLPPAKIYDINAYSISAAIKETGAEPVFLGIFQDEPHELRTALERALECSNIVVTSGGVSVGPKDIMPKTLDSLGKPGLIVGGITVKPGKPTTIALINGKLAFSLPGHPTSALLMFHILVRPIIHSMMGITFEEDYTVKARASTRMFAAKGRRTFVMVKLRPGQKKQLTADPVPTGLSGAITTLAKADGFVEIDEKTQFVDADEEVDVHLFRCLSEYRFSGL